ncbi:ABC-type polysaccharide/polyol phosphate export permease [Meinhardsimonia xiamenensis]|jgi:ABC-type polysaccharide/polyol phosphate export permease|uniref:ABC-type polysaccharide/polyol phosphate export permease n=1 Tax=Meinhardsimonia xiamenensis TaxID=990712 RepID=A0A1G9DVP4_9RHOB|nr:ABC transporter permease [Meinhardsimonia xiamenensis]PRX31177.1 ABC-type polysaccharide/polyol phosphate export permease [Meinhardsimonia xiamenensis]SDK67971.1 ABC-type polysaccharide/polyol phosphate export permease [Meinhardsimonia xiamenensis]
MFQTRAATPTTTFGAIIRTLEVIYHATVRNVRKSHGNAILGLFYAILQSLILVAVFYLMFALLGMRGNAIRGDFVLFLMSGIFIFITHNQAVGAVMGAEGPTSPMMLHAPMTTAVSITSAALASLYIQLLGMMVVLFVYHVGFNPITIEQPVYALGMVVLGWFSGVAVGLIFLALKPWMPRFTNIVSQIYRRLNMIASGKMFVANALPHSKVVLFSWNPLFHCIDQARGFTFINYTPHYTSIAYPVFFSLALVMIGLLGEFYTRRAASASWLAGK